MPVSLSVALGICFAYRKYDLLILLFGTILILLCTTCINHFLDKLYELKCTSKQAAMPRQSFGVHFLCDQRSKRTSHSPIPVGGSSAFSNRFTNCNGDRSIFRKFILSVKSIGMAKRILFPALLFLTFAVCSWLSARLENASFDGQLRLLDRISTEEVCIFGVVKDVKEEDGVRKATLTEVRLLEKVAEENEIQRVSQTWDVIENQRVSQTWDMIDNQPVSEKTEEPEDKKLMKISDRFEEQKRNTKRNGGNVLWDGIVRTERNYPELLPGDVVEIKGRIRPFSIPTNPGMFATRDYQRAGGISWSMSEPSSFLSSGTVSPKTPFGLSLLVRRKLLSFKEWLGAGIDRVAPEDCRGIFHTLILGQKEELEDEVYEK